MNNSNPIFISIGGQSRQAIIFYPYTFPSEGGIIHFSHVTQEWRERERKREGEKRREREREGGIEKEGEREGE